ncbi:hypothetical protein E2C01_100283 [Portunus trituberculatus]|uniref:Uncharacterized protein n=1 Tax=Portunus trituberculatus TaxID=210409 RepID=A0A5B7KD63_PORTR|nr:hypothetical protein [Portunus trituberculatus]
MMMVMVMVMMVWMSDDDGDDGKADERLVFVEVFLYTRLTSFKGKRLHKGKDTKLGIKFVIDTNLGATSHLLGGFETL